MQHLQEHNPDFHIHKTVVINAPIQRVWKSLTDPECIKQWFTDDPVSIQSNWQIDSEITFTGTLNGKPYINKGLILAFETEKCFSFSFWSSLSQIDDIAENYSIIEFQLLWEENKTVLKLNMDRFLNYAIYAHHRFYWNITLELFKRFIEEGNFVK